MYSSEKKQNWFEVLAGPGAVLSVRADTEEVALQKAEYALQDSDNKVWNVAMEVGMLVLAVDENERSQCETAFLRTNGKSIVARVLSTELVQDSIIISECNGQLELELESVDSKLTPV